MDDQLIEAVRKWTVLFDTLHPDYMKTKIKQKIWNEIAKTLQIGNGDEAKDMWGKLRQRHRDAIRRQKLCMRSGQGTSPKPWRYQKQMEYLLPYMTTRIRDNNSDAEKSPPDILEIEIVDDLADQNVEDTNMGESGIHITPVQNQEDEDLTFHTLAPKSKKCKTSDITELLKQSLQQHQQRANEREGHRKKIEQNKPQHDYLYHFYMSMYELTKQLPPASQHLVTTNVFKEVSQAKAGLLKNTSSVTPDTRDKYTYTFPIDE